MPDASFATGGAGLYEAVTKRHARRYAASEQDSKSPFLIDAYAPMPAWLREAIEHWRGSCSSTLDLDLDPNPSIGLPGLPGSEGG